VGQERFGGANIVTAGCYAHSAAVSEDGGPLAWVAANLFGAGVLGHDDRDDKLAPTLVARNRLLGARIGRGLRLEPLLAVAFAMGAHRRLVAGRRGEARGQEEVGVGGGEGAGRGGGQGVGGDGAGGGAGSGEDGAGAVRGLDERGAG
jgi:hypothetical protein